MPKILLKLVYNGSEVEVWCDTKWDRDHPENMADDLEHEIPGKLADMCERLVERWKNADLSAGQQILDDPRSCTHRRGYRKDGLRICSQCGAYLGE